MPRIGLDETDCSLVFKILVSLIKIGKIFIASEEKTNLCLVFSCVDRLFERLTKVESGYQPLYSLV